MTRLVLDASAAVHVVTRQASSAALLSVLRSAELITAPQLLHTEVANALWKYVTYGDIALEAASGFLEEATRLVDTYVSDHELVGEALVAAASYEHPVYDMLYAVQARRHGSKVVTTDRRFRKLLLRMKLDVYPEPGKDESHS